MRAFDSGNAATIDAWIDPPRYTGLPLTPVTQVSVFNGIAMSTFLRLCSSAPSRRIFWPLPRRLVAGTGIASSCRRYLAVSDRGSRISPSSACCNFRDTNC